MTPDRPVGAGDPDPLDLDAAEELGRNEAGRLNLVRARAEKWVGAVTALTGLLGTVLIAKGRDTVTNIAHGWRITAALSLAAALVLLAHGTYRAYQAAFGEPATLQEISPTPLTGLHARLRQARRAAADTALQHLRAAIRSVFAAMALIAGAVAVTWFAPTPTTPSNNSICVYSNGRLVAQLTATAAATHTAPGTTLGPCP